MQIHTHTHTTEYQKYVQIIVAYQTDKTVHRLLVELTAVFTVPNIVQCTLYPVSYTVHTYTVQRVLYTIQYTLYYTLHIP